MHFCVLLIILLFCENLYSKEINLFTTRHYDSDIKLFNEFTKISGIKVNVITGKAKPLEKRILSEGKECKGDLFFLADAGRLVSSEQKGVFRKIKSSFLDNTVPKRFRSEHWFGITKRARIIYYNPKFTSHNELKGLNYEDLSDIRFKNSISIRQSNNVYNQSLIASIIENNGIKYTQDWLKKFVANFSREPSGNDRAQILSVAAGESKLAIANTYYYALMISGKKGKEQQNAAREVKPFFPNQQNRGTHMNISGIGVLTHSPNPKLAVEFIEFLLSDKAQKHIVENTYEYPMIDSVQPSDPVIKMGTNFKQDEITSVSKFGKWQKEAYKLMKNANWN